MADDTPGSYAEQRRIEDARLSEDSRQWAHQQHLNSDGEPCDCGHAPDIVGRVVTHERELLRRAAAMIDPEHNPSIGRYEERLDWLAKYREVIS